jgi:hypothetical protein
MQFQAELRQTLSKLFEKTLGFRPAFEAHHKIVGVADDNLGYNLRAGDPL